MLWNMINIEYIAPIAHTVFISKKSIYLLLNKSVEASIEKVKAY